MILKRRVRKFPSLSTQKKFADLGRSVAATLLPLFLAGVGAHNGHETTNEAVMANPHPDTPPERETKPAMMRGLRRKCPNCGEGVLFNGYLKVTDTCPVCSEELHHHRADDGPAYLTILIVAHFVGFIMHVSFVHLRPDPLVLAVVLTIVCVSLSLYLLPRLKGMIVAIQWARRMHGFGASA